GRRSDGAAHGTADQDDALAADRADQLQHVCGHRLDRLPPRRNIALAVARKVDGQGAVFAGQLVGDLLPDGATQPDRMQHDQGGLAAAARRVSNRRAGFEAVPHFGNGNLSRYCWYSGSTSTCSEASSRTMPL